MKKLIYIGLLASLFFGCEEGGILFSVDISGQQVEILAPQDGTMIEANTVFFDWNEIEDAETYEVQVATPDFENTEQLLLSVTDSVTSQQLEMTPGIYEWRVRALNDGFETAFNTAAFEVIPVQNFSDYTVLLIAPTDNFITNASDITFEWSPVTDATLYRLQLMDNSTVIEEQAISETQITLSVPEGDLSWQVRAENGSETTLYSMRDLLIDRTVPNTPVAESPADGEELTSQQVTFTWTRTPVEGSTELDSIYIFRDKNLTDLVLKEGSSSPFTTTLSNDTYYWTLKAFDEAGNESTSSEALNFIVNE